MTSHRLTSHDLAALLDEANHHPWESLRAALVMAGDLSHPRGAWLLEHIAATKLEDWTLIAGAAPVPGPPLNADLPRLMVWEVEAARALPAPALNVTLTHAQTAFTVAELLRLNARHTVWHAGQLAALAAAERSGLAHAAP